MMGKKNSLDGFQTFCIGNSGYFFQGFYYNLFPLLNSLVVCPVQISSFYLYVSFKDVTIHAGADTFSLLVQPMYDATPNIKDIFASIFIAYVELPAKVQELSYIVYL